MHEQDMKIGLSLIAFSILLGGFSALIYPRILAIMQRDCILHITAPIAVTASAILIIIGLLIFLASFMLDDNKK